MNRKFWVYSWVASLNSTIMHNYLMYSERLIGVYLRGRFAIVQYNQRIQPTDNFCMVTLPICCWRSFQVHYRNHSVVGKHVQNQDRAKCSSLSSNRIGQNTCLLQSQKSLCLCVYPCFFPFSFYLWTIVRGICILSCSVTCEVNVFSDPFYFVG